MVEEEGQSGRMRGSRGDCPPISDSRRAAGNMPVRRTKRVSMNARSTGGRSAMASAISSNTTSTAARSAGSSGSGFSPAVHQVIGGKV